MRNINYRIDVVNSLYADLRTAPCGMDSIKYLGSKAPKGKQVQDIIDLAKPGEAVLLSRWQGQSSLTGDYVVYGVQVK